ncbi:DNA-3-methyladenine glycosylase 2 family protein [Actinopolymorpha pittospori]|uniref:DNA-3-methyladenine glycosylase II n=1 Tax=Actinopolymorpha pittospori TaxID=648752 RepID=A0A927REM1_9ACTN|nr:DNA-3-methyladenine glycosylase 2 [Actinopolymorpha pittospori]MBE1612334.1 AraC family transcriptional regulator of adaptative response / DNA-3-methyladenine glycosylase II [Actinopolymorpha pittospori]
MPSFEQCYRAVESRDSRFDGWIYIAVTSTGIYCRPSCPATMPKRQNSRFYATAAAAQEAGFRACRRCLPDAVPGSPEWDLRADVAARAMRLVDDGVVEREGVGGLAARLGYTPRHLGRLLVSELGAGPLALARARRAHTARLLLETTALPITDVAFAAGFGSVRQFNDTIRTVFASTPTEVRQASRRKEPTNGAVVLRLPYRPPYDVDSVWRYLQGRLVPGLEEVDGPTYRRAVQLHHGAAILELTPGDGFVRCALRLDDLRDLGPAAARCRRLLHLDADPAGVAEVLGRDPLLGPLVRARPGLRVPGSVDPFETAVRAVIGQQVSVSAAATVAGRLVTTYADPLAHPSGSLTHTFPTAESLASADRLPMPKARTRTLTALAAGVVRGDLDLSPGADQAEADAALRALPGLGPWTASYVALRGLGDPDAFPGTDLGIRRALVRLGVEDQPQAIAALAERWRPLRSYAAQHLWTHGSAAGLDGGGETGGLGTKNHHEGQAA